MFSMRDFAVCAAVCLSLAGCSAPPEKKAPAAAQPELPKIAPAVFRVTLATSKGDIVIEAHKDWAPAGVDQFYSLVRSGFFDGARFYRVVRDYVAQWGIAADPETNRLWASAVIPDDAVKHTNARGAVSFAAAGPHTRTTQLFINLEDHPSLDKQGFAPIGEVVSGMDVADRLYFLYGDMPPRGAGPDPAKMATQGNDYLVENFPRLDSIKKATIQ